ncbi:hypothetical protein [Sporosarcina beigongshangi]|uniref:hypothetical protein n=1 Tax=Sporosarcina beigongshangi TaxID=2782538 RepID=UPI00193989E7|nr:hypothetical protein [Sporosarcina beigongshangi]
MRQVGRMQFNPSLLEGLRIKALFAFINKIEATRASGAQNWTIERAASPSINGPAALFNLIPVSNDCQ